MFGSIITQFRLIGFIEGISYLALLFIAMPMKYIYGDPVPVKIIGMTHGILFILFMILLIAAAQRHRWSFKFNALMFMASLVPFGTFFTDSKLKALQVARASVSLKR
jgi:integral membrane protein